jgi:microsomal dipeptidase-like Zn-dependent dipeptidase
VRQMIADLHAHYAMHLEADTLAPHLKALFSPDARVRVLDRVPIALVRLGSRFANYQSVRSGPRVTVPLMRSGGVGIALSVLYQPFCEMDLSKRYGARPDPGYVVALLRQLELVERDLEQHFPDDAAIVRNPLELEEQISRGRLALLHCVEGGFHLGATPEAVDNAVAELARRGVAYITVAHLFWRSVATNAPAIPFLPDRVYDRIFPQPDVGLSELGRAALEAMVRERVLIDVSHMNGAALERTFELLDHIDPERSVPVVATHSAYRFGRQRYNLDTATVMKIAERQGVIGLIFAEHQACDGLRRRRTDRLEDSLAVLFRHIDRIREISGSHRHVGIGSDLDGYIKPTLAGLENMNCMGALEEALVSRYGDDDAALICSGNVLRLLCGYWRGSVRPGVTAPSLA